MATPTAPIVVKVYNKPKKYQQDAERMAAAGYTVTSTTQGHRRTFWRGFLFAKNEITVTYSRIA